MVNKLGKNIVNKLEKNSVLAGWIILFLNVISGFILTVDKFYPQYLPRFINTPNIIMLCIVFTFIIKPVFDNFLSNLKNRGKLSGDSFVKEYTEILDESIKTSIQITAILSSLKADAYASTQNLSNSDTFKKDTTRRIIRGLLQNIRSIIITYYDSKTELEIHSNLMLPDQDWENTKVRFIDKERPLSENYSCLLCLKEWSDDRPAAEIRVGFALPVAIEEQNILFGAPKAYTSGKYQVVNNTEDSKEIEEKLKNLPNEIQEEIRNFLASKDYKSFVSLPLFDYGKNCSLGVINIQSNKPFILSKDLNEQEIIIKYLNPFITILAQVVSKLEGIY